ncbi:unnamed protein product [Symbiodinium sp. KB8]|nr:unnamed protein product [Symbiodinium sp. KB8]
MPVAQPVAAGLPAGPAAPARSRAATQDELKPLWSAVVAGRTPEALVKARSQVAAGAPKAPAAPAVPTAPTAPVVPATAARTSWASLTEGAEVDTLGIYLHALAAFGTVCTKDHGGTLAITDHVRYFANG